MGSAIRRQEKKDTEPSSLDTMFNVNGGISANKEIYRIEQLEDCDNLMVISDYPCRNISEPIFKIGERLKGLSQDGCWWKVCSPQTGTENYIPNNHVAKVYHGWLFEGVGRQKAEELLSLPGNSVGSFLIRESPRERGVYSLSVRHRTVKHYKIFRLTNSWFYISPRLTFQCLEDMVNHYSDSSDGICCVLSAPCLALSASAPNTTHDRPVVMRRNLDWKKVNSSQLINPNEVDWVDNRDNAMSFGVRSSIAAYMSLTSIPQPENSKDRKKKSKSIYVIPDHNNVMDDEF